MSHTPGPWTISHGGMPGDDGFSVASNNAAAKNVKVICEYWPCTIVSNEHREELRDNARLIAQAPAMLEELRAALAWYEKDRWIDEYNGVKPNPMLLENIKRIEAIIRKATGDE